MGVQELTDVAINSCILQLPRSCNAQQQISDLNSYACMSKGQTSKRERREKFNQTVCYVPIAVNQR